MKVNEEYPWPTGSLLLAALAIVASIIYCPQVVSYDQSVQYDWLWDSRGLSIAWGRLVLEWVGIAVAGVALALIARPNTP